MPIRKWQDYSLFLRISYKEIEKRFVPYLTERQMTAGTLHNRKAINGESYRDKVLMSTLYDTGARVQELCDIKMKDVRLEKPAIITPSRKRRR